MFIKLTNPLHPAQKILININQIASIMFVNSSQTVVIILANGKEIFVQEI